MHGYARSCVRIVRDSLPLSAHIGQLIKHLINYFFSFDSALAVATASCSSDEAEEISILSPVEFLGTWQIGCSLSDVGDFNSSYQIINDTISETEIRSECPYYDDDSCLNP